MGFTSVFDLHEPFHDIFHFSVEDAVIFCEYCIILKRNNSGG